MKVSILLLLSVQLYFADVVFSYGYQNNYHRSYSKGQGNRHSYGRHRYNVKPSGYGRGYGKSWNYHSRPKNQYKPHFQKSSVLLPSGATENIIDPRVGKTWNCGKKSKLIDLSPTGKMSKKEYDIVKQEVDKANKGAAFTITKIQKIENACLWKRYKHRQKDILVETKTLNERMLFHGSHSNLELMNIGFNEQYAKLTGSFGAGVYFADQSSLSHWFTKPQPDGTRHMLFCRVTMGNMYLQTTGANQFPHAPIGYHSVKGMYNPPEYIVYRGEQAYPAFLVSYK